MDFCSRLKKLWNVDESGGQDERLRETVKNDKSRITIAISAVLSSLHDDKKELPENILDLFKQFTIAQFKAHTDEWTQETSRSAEDVGSGLKRFMNCFKLKGPDDKVPEWQFGNGKRPRSESEPEP